VYNLLQPEYEPVAHEPLSTNALSTNGGGDNVYAEPAPTRDAYAVFMDDKCTACTPK